MRRIVMVGILAAALSSCALGGSGRTDGDQPGEEEEEGEYEVVGRIDHQLDAADRFVILVQATPCDLATLAEVTPLGGWDSVLGISSERLFGLEGLFNEEGEAFLCGFAVDSERRIIRCLSPEKRSCASTRRTHSPRNPLRFRVLVLLEGSSATISRDFAAQQAHEPQDHAALAASSCS